jgi:hypothetical protein
LGWKQEGRWQGPRVAVQGKSWGKKGGTKAGREHTWGWEDYWEDRRGSGVQVLAGAGHCIWRLPLWSYENHGLDYDGEWV